MKLEEVYPIHEVHQKAKQQPYLLILKMIADALDPGIPNHVFARRYKVRFRGTSKHDIQGVRTFREVMRKIMNHKSAAGMRREIEDLMRILGRD